MCNYFSCLIDKNGKTYWKIGINSHGDLEKYFKITDNEDRSEFLEFAKIEVDPKTKKVIVDEPIPSWFNEGYNQFCLDSFNECEKTMKDYVFEKNYKGNLDLNGCTLPENLKLPETVGCNLDLSGCTLPENLKLPETVEGSLYLQGCTFPANLKLPEKLKNKIIR